MSLTPKQVKSTLYVILSILTGSFLCALSLNVFYIPGQLLSGGATGVALLLHYQFGWSTALMVVLINIPLFLLSWKLVSRDFFVYSLVGTAVFSVMVELTKDLRLAYDSRLTTVALGGILNGLGIGVAFRAGASFGGSDIISKILHKYFSFNMAAAGLVVNAGIVFFSIFIFGLDLAVLTLAAMFISSKVTSYVIEGMRYKRAVFIITGKDTDMAAAILAKIHRGVTVLEARGAYTGQSKSMLYCVISKRQVAPLRQIVKDTDPQAFVTVAEASQVYGYGNGFYAITGDE